MSSQLHDQLDYLKSLAEDGSRMPVMNGGNLFWAGVCFSTAALIHYGIMLGIVPIPNPWFISLLWFVAVAVYAVLGGLKIAEGRRKYGQNAMNRAISAAWSGVGMAIFALFLTLTAVGSQMKAIEVLTTLIAPMILLLYGIGWWVASIMSGQGWLRLVAFGCLIGAPVLGLLGHQAVQMLAYAVALTLFATIPGLILMRAEKG
ncbi:hypothetical protein PQU92_09735 [Asticcacaulis sp. BYS171W]|uniref:Yip1 domain-containing protein n=1 Tax=Asticcacaulis aquaticus TaxID=2984212 RepID=A0ABT5HUG6_9CAUL|nr:hypothetical protein [Asticcacaulis aquaticus]MDC7683557.1 hypothetical protein [Asticcacaulis aquaticus]